MTYDFPIDLEISMQQKKKRKFKHFYLFNSIYYSKQIKIQIQEMS